MDIQTILDKIMNDARQNASVILADAGKKAEEMNRALDSRLEDQREQIMERVRRESAETMERMRRMADLEHRKERLAARRIVLDEAFRKAADLIAEMPDERKREFFLELAVSNSDTDAELDIGTESNGWYDDGFIRDLNHRLTPLSSGVEIKPGKKCTGCGFVLRNDVSSTDCRVEALIESRRLELESEAADILFP